MSIDNPGNWKLIPHARQRFNNRVMPLIGKDIDQLREEWTCLPKRLKRRFRGQIAKNRVFRAKRVGKFWVVAIGRMKGDTMVVITFYVFCHPHNRKTQIMRCAHKPDCRIGKKKGKPDTAVLKSESGC